MSSELITHLVIDAVITFIILYFILKHIRETEVFYNESRIEWERRQEMDNRLEQKLNNYLLDTGIENKRRLFLMNNRANYITMYLDDLRTPTEEFDFIVRSYDEAISVIKQYGIPSFISFDHDLGSDEDGDLLKTGYDLVKWIVESDLDNNYKLPQDFQYKVHSQNPIGKQNIISLLDGYLKHKDKHNDTEPLNSSEVKQSLLTHYLANMSQPHKSV